MAKTSLETYSYVMFNLKADFLRGYLSLKLDKKEMNVHAVFLRIRKYPVYFLLQSREIETSFLKTLPENKPSSKIIRIFLSLWPGCTERRSLNFKDWLQVW